MVVACLDGILLLPHVSLLLQTEGGEEKQETGNFLDVGLLQEVANGKADRGTDTTKTTTRKKTPPFKDRDAGRHLTQQKEEEEAGVDDVAVFLCVYRFCRKTEKK